MTQPANLRFLTEAALATERAKLAGIAAGATVNRADSATDAAISTAVGALVGGASAAYDTLGELATQLASDENAAAALATLVGTKAPLASPAFTGTPTKAGTALATTADVAASTLSLPVNAMSANGTAVIGARNSVNASAGPIAVTLPTPTAVGQHLIIERADTSTVAANAITITGTIRGTAGTVVTLAAVGAAFEGALYIAESLTSWAIASSIKPRAVLDAAYEAKGAVAAQAVTDAATYLPRVRSRVVWSLGDSTAAGAPAGAFTDTEMAASVAIAKAGITFQTSQWQPWGLLASQGRWTLGGIVATGGYTSAQIRDTLLPQLLTVAQRGDTVIVQAGTNGQVIADTRDIYDRLRAAGLYTIAVSIAPSTSSTIANVEAFNAKLKDYANANGIPLVDSYGLFVEPTTGAYKTVYLNDGVHPNAAGFQALGQLIASALGAIFPTDPGMLVRHNVASTAQLARKPLGGGVVGTELSAFAALGTSTVTTVADTDFQGGQCYQLTRGDSAILLNADSPSPTLTAGRRYRLGFALKTSFATPGAGLWQVFLESNTTGARHFWGFGYPSYMQINQSSIGRLYSEITIPVTDAYRFRVTCAGAAGDWLRIGEITLQDLTSQGVA